MASIYGMAVALGDCEELVYSVSDLSDSLNKRMRIVFLNGYGLSILGETLGLGMGADACCCTREIAVWSPEGNLVPDFFDGKSTLGFADSNEIMECAEKICELI